MKRNELIQERKILGREMNKKKKEKILSSFLRKKMFSSSWGENKVS